MPNTITWYQCAVWFCLAFFLSFGWGMGQLVSGIITSAVATAI